MRVLMAVAKSPFRVVGGLEGQVHELAKALVQRRHAVYALSSRFDRSQQAISWMEGIHVHRVKWIECRLARFVLFPFGLARMLFKLRKHSDLVHIHNISWFGAFVTLFAKAARLAVITKLPNVGEFGIAGMRRAQFSFLRIALLKISDAAVAMTPESAAELTAIGYPETRVLKVCNGISLLSPPLSRPFASSPIEVVYAGRLSPEKGLTDLLHSWAAVKARTSQKIKLRIVGAGPQDKQLRELSSDLALGDTLEFCGYRSDVPAELSRAQIFVLPSYAEGNSNAILEAMRAGLPIVATRIGGAPVQVGSEGENFLYPPHDRTALTDKLLTLIEDEALRHRLGKAMRERVQELFAIEHVAAAYERAYELLLSGRRHQLGQLNTALFS